MILVAVRDLVFRSKIHAAAERLGVAVRFAPRFGTLEEAAREAGGGTLLADLTEPGVLDGVRVAKRSGPVRVIGFLGHLQVRAAARRYPAVRLNERRSRGSRRAQARAKAPAAGGAPAQL
jgi:hypothetical protein